MTTPPTGPTPDPNQPGAQFPGSGYGQQPVQPGQPVYPQQPQPGQQPFGQPQVDQTQFGHPQFGQQQYDQFGQPIANQPLNYGQSQFAAAPAAKSSMAPVLFVVGGLVVVTAIVAGLFFGGVFDGDKKDSKSAGSSTSVEFGTGDLTTPEEPSGTQIEPGECIRIESTTPVSFDAVSCSPADNVFIVGSIESPGTVCHDRGYDYFITHSDLNDGDPTCLIPNLVKGSCYAESPDTDSLDLTEVSCSESTTESRYVFNVSEETDSKTVPNCSDPELDKAIGYDIESSPTKEIGFCLRIVGAGYYWIS